MNQKKPENDIDRGAMAWGFVIGGFLGSLIALFLNPHRGAQTRQQIVETSSSLRDQLEETIIPVDSLAESLEEGKVAARRRRAELDLSK